MDPWPPFFKCVPRGRQLTRNREGGEAQTTMEESAPSGMWPADSEGVVGSVHTGGTEGN